MAVRTAALVLAAAFFGSADGIRLSLPNTCGRSGMSPNQKIVNGTDAEKCQWKWHVGLMFGSVPFCGGTLISPEWVLTAAHCMVLPRFRVVAGEFDIRKPSRYQQSRWSKDVYTHPDYTGSAEMAVSGIQYDFALVEVNREFDITRCVRFACLPNVEVADGSTCWITGWGSLSYDGPYPNILQQAQVEVIDHKRCANNFGWPQGIIHETNVCAHGKNDDKNISAVCHGDSGGALICKGTGTWSLVGVASCSLGCARPKAPAIFGNVSFARGWIMDVLDGGGCPNSCKIGACKLLRRCRQNKACSCR